MSIEGQRIPKIAALSSKNTQNNWFLPTLFSNFGCSYPLSTSTSEKTDSSRFSASKPNKLLSRWFFYAPDNGYVKSAGTSVGVPSDFQGLRLLVPIDIFLQRRLRVMPTIVKSLGKLFLKAFEFGEMEVAWKKYSLKDRYRKT